MKENPLTGLKLVLKAYVPNRRQALRLLRRAYEKYTEIAVEDKFAERVAELAHLCIATGTVLKKETWTIAQSACLPTRYLAAAIYGARWRANLCAYVQAVSSFLGEDFFTDEDRAEWTRIIVKKRLKGKK